MNRAAFRTSSSWAMALVFLLLAPMTVLAADATISNELLEVRWQEATGRISLVSKASGLVFVATRR